MGSKSAPTAQTQQTSTVSLPAWVDSSAQSNLRQAYNVSNNLLGPYQGPTYAGLSNGGQADIAGLQSLPGSTEAANNLAQNTLGNLTSYAPGTINAPTLAGTDLSSYMNPYTQAVTNSGLRAIDTQRLQALNGNADQAISQGAFGGSRQGVQEGITNAGASTAAGTLASQLALQNYQNAQSAAQYDIGNNLSTQQANVANGLAGAGLNANAASGLSSVAGNGQTQLLTALQAALGGQSIGQADQQGKLTADQNAYTAAQQFPLQQLQIPSSILSATPYGQTTNTTGTSNSGNSGNGLASGLGAAASIAGIAASFF
jgi:hypothetical protein